MKVKRKIIQIDEEKCTGCGQCVLACAEGAIQIINGKAKVMSDNLCDGLGACIGDCPEDALHIIEREADEFDEAAVEKHLETLQKQEKPARGEGEPATLACGCPSSHVQTFITETPCQAANRPKATTPSPASALTHWPVQISLVPPTAPFLKSANLLVAADCVPVAFPRLHAEFLPGRAIMIGCPKFDDKKAYVEKFTQVFATAGIKSVTCVMMEVPCCSGLPMILKEAMQASSVKVPMEVITVSARGEILERRKM
jgi:NAD-dependent dihydropyrimidine dehydrogenase PreA subunit